RYEPFFPPQLLAFDACNRSPRMRSVAFRSVLVNQPVAAAASPQVNAAVPPVHNTCGTTRMSSSVAPAGMTNVAVCVSDVASSVNSAVFAITRPEPPSPVTAGVAKVPVVTVGFTTVGFVIVTAPVNVMSAPGLKIPPDVGITSPFSGDRDHAGVLRAPPRHDHQPHLRWLQVRPPPAGQDGGRHTRVQPRLGRPSCSAGPSLTGCHPASRPTRATGATPAFVRSLRGAAA